MIITKQEVTRITLLCIVWRSILFLVGSVAGLFVPYNPTFPYFEVRLLNSGLPQWLYSWANFDGVHYLLIAQEGYFGTGLVQAFFPVYPGLINLMATIADNFLLSGLLVSNIAFLGVLLVFFSLVKNTFTTSIAWKALVLLLLFPTSFFGVALYNESVFLLFVLAAFYSSQQKNWLWAGIFAAVASATRVVGVFVTIGLLLEVIVLAVQQSTVFSKKNWNFKTVVSEVLTYILAQKKRIALLSIGFLGLLSYMCYLWFVFGDPLYFLHVQSEFNTGRQESLVLLPQTLWRGVKILLTVSFDLRYFFYLQELLFTCAALLVLLLGFKKQYAIPYAWLFFGLLAVILPTATGTLSSMPRYVLVAFPIFVILAQLQLSRFVWYMLYVSSGALLLWNTIVFIQGSWVA